MGKKRGKRGLSWGKRGKRGLSSNRGKRGGKEDCPLAEDKNADF
jgi:hypothetical protein